MIQTYEYWSSCSTNCVCTSALECSMLSQVHIVRKIHVEESMPMCQTPFNRRTNERTDGRTRRRVYLFVHSFVRICLLCLSGASILWGTNRDASHKFKRGGDKNQRSTNKYTKFDQLTIGKIIKIIATKCH